MFFRRFFLSRPSSLDDGSSLRSGRSPTYTSNIVSPPGHPGQTQSSAGATTTTNPRYGERLSCFSILSFLPTRLLGVYYRVFLLDSAHRTLHPATPDDPFLGRVLATSIAPPHNVDSLQRCLAKHEGINELGHSLSLFLTGSSHKPMKNTRKIDISNCTGAGSTPQEALALIVSKIENWGQKGIRPP